MDKFFLDAERLTCAAPTYPSSRCSPIRLILAPWRGGPPAPCHLVQSFQLGLVVVVKLVLCTNMFEQRIDLCSACSSKEQPCSLCSSVLERDRVAKMLEYARRPLFKCAPSRQDALACSSTPFRARAGCQDARTRWVTPVHACPSPGISTLDVRACSTHVLSTLVNNNCNDSIT